MLRKSIFPLMVAVLLLFLVFMPLCNSYKIIGDPVPDLDCDGEIGWVDVIPGATVEDSFIVKNIGDPNSELNWEVDSWPEWGEWRFDPDDGTGLKPEDETLTVVVEVDAPYEHLTEFGGEVKIINSDNPEDFHIFELSLITPTKIQKNTEINIYKFLLLISEQFPNVFPILRQLVGL
ncbi:MAG: hypothetical protein R6V50_05570 [Thermoplasmatota archaeon]